MESNFVCNECPLAIKWKTTVSEINNKSQRNVEKPSSETNVINSILKQYTHYSSSGSGPNVFVCGLNELCWQSCQIDTNKFK